MNLESIEIDGHFCPNITVENDMVHLPTAFLAYELVHGVIFGMHNVKK